MGLFNGDADGYGGRDYDLYPLTTRERIKQFNIAFGRPVNTMPITPSVSDRILLGKLLLEETLETLTLGLGLCVYDQAGIVADASGTRLTVEHREGDKYDPVETADGMGDVNVVNHHIAHWLGFNLDRITAHINDSNMSKLGEDGKAIINGVTPGYEEAGPDGIHAEGFDPSKPIGKILKGPNFWDAKPGIPAILALGND